MFFLRGSMPEPMPEADVPTAPLRLHLTRLRRAMREAEHMLERLEQVDAKKQGEYIYLIDNFIFEGIADHMAAETQILLPAAETLAVEGATVLSLRISANGVRGLAATFHTQVTAAKRDLAQLYETGVKTLRMAQAHFDVEETSLFPSFDASMTKKEVERTLSRPMASHSLAIKPMEHSASSHHMEKYHRHGRN